MYFNKMKKINRRKFIKNSSLTAATAITSNFIANSCNENIPASEGMYMGDFSAPKLNNIRVAFIGVGARGSGHLAYFGGIPNTEVVAVSDLYEDNIDNSIKRLKNKLNTKKLNNISKYWGEENKWKLMLDEVKPDVVFISTNWDNHAPMAIESMKKGAHVFVEVPIATNLEDCLLYTSPSPRDRG